MSLYWDQGWGSGVLSAVAASSSLAFYRQLFAGGVVMGGEERVPALPSTASSLQEAPPAR